MHPYANLWSALVRDKAFIAAAVAAPLTWFLLWQWRAPVIDWGWPLQTPGRYLLLVVIYPLLEEYVFRGGLQPWLARYSANRCAWRGVSRANVLTSILFSALHLFAHTPLWALAVFIPSLIFGFFRDRYASIQPSVVLHVFYNAGFFLLFKP